MRAFTRSMRVDACSGPQSQWLLHSAPKTFTQSEAEIKLVAYSLHRMMLTFLQTLYIVAQDETAAYNEHKAEKRAQIAQQTRQLQPQMLGELKTLSLSPSFFSPFLSPPLSSLCI